MNLLPLLIIGGGAMYLYKLYSDGQQVEFNVTEVAVTNLKNAAVNGWVKVVFENPTNTTFNISDLSVRLFVGNTEVGRNVDGPAFSIPAQQKDQPAPQITHKINFKIPIENLPEAVQAVITGGKLGNVRFDTTFRANGINVPTLSKTFEL